MGDVSADYAGLSQMVAALPSPHAAAMPANAPFRHRPAVLRPAVALCLALASLGTRADAPEPSAQRQRELVRMVRQDCGSCHGLHLTGGLGPALTREALAGKPLESMTSTIYGGRPGTPMAPWKAMLTEDEAHWIARQLLAGFPEPMKGSE